MPRAKQVVSESLDKKQLNEHALSRCIKLYSPHTVVEAMLVGHEDRRKPWAVVYTAPRGGDREVVSLHRRKATARKRRDQYDRLWALGYMSSGLE